MLKPGDVVFVEDSASVDCNGTAWEYVKDNRDAVVAGIALFSLDREDLPADETVYALEWPLEFEGGHECKNTCLPRRGQFVSGKHLSLQFEKSRPQAITVPNIQQPV